MTFLDAARRVLEQAGEPLHYSEIYRRAAAAQWVESDGATPEATMGSRLYTTVKTDGSGFVQVGRGIFDLANRRAGGIDAQIRTINEKTRNRLRTFLITMRPRTFEILIKQLLLQMGFDEPTVHVGKYYKDGGVDVVGTYSAAGLTSVNVAIQAKRWKHNVGAPIVTALRGSLHAYQQGIIIALQDFTASAREEAARAGVTRIGLINGEELIDLLIKHHVGVTDRTLTVSDIHEEWWITILGAPTASALPEAVEELPAAPESDPTPPRTAQRSPITFTLFDEIHQVKSWKSLLVTVADTLAVRHGESFAPAVLPLHGRKRRPIAHSGEGMIAPMPIGASGLWIETNASAKSIVRFCEQMLRALGHAPSDLSILP